MASREARSMSSPTRKNGTMEVPVLHRGRVDLPFVDLRNGSEVQLLHVDLEQNLWVARQRFEPGTVLPRHRHTGPVQVFTVSGRWQYREYDVINTAGSYLYEPAGSVHTFTVPADNTEITEITFSIWGANLNLDDDDNVVGVDDASSVLAYYLQQCNKMGLPRPNLIER
jgi:2,4'-dihydroxyacetophenone dioxygenase